MANQRKAPRGVILKSGTIILARLPCSARNLSETGACLEVQATFEIPSTFLFEMPGQPPQTCKVVWRSDTRLGPDHTKQRDVRIQPPQSAHTDLRLVRFHRHKISDPEKDRNRTFAAPCTLARCHRGCGKIGVLQGLLVRRCPSWAAWRPHAGWAPAHSRNSQAAVRSCRRGMKQTSFILSMVQGGGKRRELIHFRRSTLTTLAG